MDIGLRRATVRRWAFATHFFSRQPRSGIPVLRLDLLIVLILALVVGAITASATGHFEPLPLLAGVIVAGVVRSVRMAKQRS